MAYRKSKDIICKNYDKVPDHDPNNYDIDIIFNFNGKNFPMRKEIDPFKPKSKGGTNHPKNLNAMQSSQTRPKGVTYPYNFKEKENLGKTRYDLIETEIDKRSVLIRNGSLLLNYNGTIDGRSSAVLDGSVILKKDGTIDKRSSALINGLVFFKN